MVIFSFSVHITGQLSHCHDDVPRKNKMLTLSGGESGIHISFLSHFMLDPFRTSLFLLCGI